MATIEVVSATYTPRLDIKAEYTAQSIARAFSEHILIIEGSIAPVTVIEGQHG